MSRLWLGLMCMLSIWLGGCGGSNLGVEGTWHGTLTWADDHGTQTMFWSVFQNPANVGRSDSAVWILRLATSDGCEFDVSLGQLKPEADGAVNFPPKNITGDAACFPEITTTDLAGGNRLELEIDGLFDGDAQTASGTAVLRTRSSSGTVVQEIRTGTWDATLD